MMRRALGVMALAVVFAGCGDDDTVGDDETFSTSLEGTEGWEQLSGSATVRWVEGTTGFLANIEIEGDEPDQVRPWHVHFGTCETGGAIVGPPGDYPALETDGSGRADANATVDAELDRDADYHVNVHLSEDDLDTIIACGDLEEDEPIVEF